MRGTLFRRVSVAGLWDAAYGRGGQAMLPARLSSALSHVSPVSAGRPRGAVTDRRLPALRGAGAGAGVRQRWRRRWLHPAARYAGAGPLRQRHRPLQHHWPLTDRPRCRASCLNAPSSPSMGGGGERKGGVVLNPLCSLAPLHGRGAPLHGRGV